MLAHEVGHHVQNLLGVSADVNRAQQEDPGSANELSVRLELQADCLAGVWAHAAYQKQLLESGDLEEGLAAAAAVGDDRIQEQAGARDRPRVVDTRLVGAAAEVVPEGLRQRRPERLRHFRGRRLAGGPPGCGPPAFPGQSSASRPARSGGRPLRKCSLPTSRAIRGKCLAVSVIVVR